MGVVILEIILGLLFAGIILTGIARVAAPIADAFATRLKLKFQEIGPEEERVLKARVGALEEEVRSLKQQIANMQEGADFAVKLLHEYRSTDIAERPAPLKIVDKEKS